MNHLVTLTTLPSILSYLVISIPIFSGFYDNLDNGQLAKAISNNSFVCMQLVWQVSAKFGLFVAQSPARTPSPR